MTFIIGALSVHLSPHKLSHTDDTIKLTCLFFKSHLKREKIKPEKKGKNTRE